MGISAVYDKVVDLIEATLPSHVRLPNPYNINANTFLHMTTDAFGLTVDSGINTERYVGCLATWARSFSIPLIKRVVTTQNNMSAREVLEKGILTDWELLYKAFEGNPTLDGVVIKAIVSADSGIEFIDGERLKYLSMFINLNVEYQDTY